MSQPLCVLDDTVLAFPPVHLALNEPNGLLAVGGDLAPERIITAYSNGIFPWFSDGDPILWWSPDPRAVINIDQLHINRSLRKFLKKCDYTVSVNRAFNDVIGKCSNAPFRNDDTWILPSMQQAYQRLHQLGYAHSIEIWQNNQLVGGLYGVAIAGLFSGESMFYQQTNASKLALIALAEHLQSIGVNFIDCQLQNPFLASMGAVEISRQAFLSLKQHALAAQIPNDFWQSKALATSVLEQYC
ncbi:leucyl/phenylalanyl-tRNA--protein transferase [Thalassotalea maritima]|uniref:leucyl/phenylalanyl-tRNA--protein transferase n=1 Tax=Thalassotalea maritima TaxID=3242416 RepID=UPI00352877C4